MAQVSPQDVSIDKVAEELIQTLPQEMQAKTNETFEALQEGASFGDIYGIEHRKLEMVYSVAHTYYKNRKYEDALKMFRFLTLMDHSNQKYWLGFASTHQMMQDFEKAVEAYGYATLLDIANPKPQLQAGYCLLQLKKYEEARNALEGVLLIDDIDDKTRLQAEALLGRVRRGETAPENGAESSKN